VAILAMTCLLLAGAPAHAAPILSVSSTTANIADVIDFVTVDVSIDNAVDVYAYQFGIQFNPSILGVFDVVEGDFLSNAGSTIFIPGAVGGTPGLLEFTSGTLVGAVPGANGSGRLFSVLFSVHNPGVSLVSVVFDALNGDGILNSALGDIEGTESTSGTVTIEPRLPEPATALLVLAGVGGLMLRRRARRV
jgi:hypothetical protein